MYLIGSIQVGEVLSGVPQGSVLGPILFVIYINDIDDSVNYNILKFADGTKIYKAIYSEEDICKVQTDLCNLIAWSEDWQMLFNADKCKVMHMGYNNRYFDYLMSGSKLESVNEEKDLGVIVSDDLKWEKHWSAAVRKANRILGTIKQKFSKTAFRVLLPNTESQLQQGY